MIHRDIVFWDDVGSPISPLVAARTGMGGSEFEVGLIATELARRGASVRVLSRLKDEDVTRVEFSNTGYVEFTNQLEIVRASTCVIHRYSSFPWDFVQAENNFVLATDIGGDGYAKYDLLMRSSRMTLICVSQVHNKQYPVTWKKTVLPYMMPPGMKQKLCDNVRDLDKYIFASSRVKGLHPTLEAWKCIKYPGAVLNVYSPGYDMTSKDEVEIDPSIKFHGSVPTDQIMTEMASSAGMVLVNTYPEMFGLAPVLAEQLGCRMHVLYGGDPGALPDVLSSELPTNDPEVFIERFARERVVRSEQSAPRDFSIERWIPEWEKTLLP